MSSYEFIDSDTINHEIKQPPPRPPREAWSSSDTRHGAGTRPPDRRSRDEVQFMDEEFNPEQRRYPPSEMMPDKEMFQSMLDRFQLAMNRNEELQNEINKMREISTTKIDETAQAIKVLKRTHKKELEKEKKISSEATKQFEDAKIVVLSYKSKNIEVEATVRSLREEITTHKETISNLENRISHLMQGTPIGGRPQQPSMQGDTREVERLRKDYSILKEELKNYKMALELKDQDFEELREKRDAYKDDYTRAAMERDALRKDSFEMKRRYDDLVEENAKNKKELSALRQRLQQIHIDNNTLQRNLQDTKQQLESLDVSAKISQKDRESVSQEVQKQYEEDWIKLKQESSGWRAKYLEVLKKLEDAEKHNEDEQIYLKGVIDSLKVQLERKDKEWMNLESGPTERDDELLRQVEDLQQEAKMAYPYRYNSNPQAGHRPPPQPYPQYSQYPPQQRRGYPPQNAYHPPNPSYGQPQNRIPQPQMPRPTYPPPQTAYRPTNAPQPTGGNPPLPDIGSRKQSLSDVRITSNRIKSLSKNELQEIQDNEEKFLELFTSMRPDIPDLARLTEDREKLQEENRGLAAQTLEKEPVFAEGVKKLLAITEEHQMLQGQYQSAYDRMVELVSKFEIPEIRRDLQKLSTTAEDDGEALVDSFLLGRTPYDDFHERYFNLRKSYWLRKVKLEKLDDLDKKKRQGQNPYNQPVPYPRGGGGGGDGVPVPLPRHYK